MPISATDPNYTIQRKLIVHVSFVPLRNVCNYMQHCQSRDIMRFLIRLHTSFKNTIPINYQYPLSAAIYSIINKADYHYASFLHERGYGKGFKFFSFSQLRSPFRIEGDRMKLLSPHVEFEITFHMPEASQNFIKGLFMSQRIEIADRKSKVSFMVTSVESLANPFQGINENQIINIRLKPISPMVVGLHNQEGNYEFLAPDDRRFSESLIYNWRNKISASYDEQTAREAVLLIEIILLEKPPKSRLITVKAGEPEETKIRGWMHFALQVTGEKQFVELLMNCGAGVYNAQGMGCVGVLEKTSKEK